MTNFSLEVAVRRSLLAVVVLVAAFHVVVNVVSPYGFQRDEFLYMAMGAHLRWWRMDFPPFIALVANMSRELFGSDPWAVRMVPAVAGGVLAALTVHLSRRLASGEASLRTRASWVALLALLCAPVFLRPANLLQPVVFDQLWWTVSLWGLLERERTSDHRWWLVVGGGLGLGLLTKFSIVFIGVGLVAGVLLTPLRADLRTRWPWLALLIALVIGAPSLSGQVQLDYPLLWQMRDLQQEQLAARNPLGFFAEQPLLAGPAAFALAMWGLWWLFARGAGRAVAIAIVVCWLWLGWQQGKAYYGAPVYPLLFAAGAAALAERTAHARPWAIMAFTAVLVMLGVISLPLALPILSPARTAAYAARLGISNATETNRGTQLPLPQDFADMLGWPQQVAAVAEEWARLTPAERRDAVLVASNYGRAGALDFYGPRLGLPPVVSAEGSYWFFGPGDRAGTTLISLGDRPEDLAFLYTRCRLLRTVGTSWSVEEEQAVPITRCDGPKQTLAQAWPALHPARQ